MNLQPAAARAMEVADLSCRLRGASRRFAFSLRALSIVLLLCLLDSSARAEPWLAPGDLALRSDLQALADSGLLKTPVTTWPLPWSDIASAVDEASSADADAFTLAALERVRQRARMETRVSELALSARAAYAEKPIRIRTFDETPREDGEASFGMSWTGNRVALHLTGTAVTTPVDGDSFRFDGSYAGLALGNWMLSAGYPERWWGPGWDGSLILSTNARPTPQIAINRNRATPFEQRWLRWVGPWSLTAFMGSLDDTRVLDGALLFGVRASAKPLPRLEIGISRTAQWCGEGQPCDAKTFFNLLAGKDNRGVNVNPDEEPGNQLGGVDLRWALPYRHVPLAFYLQWIGEDSRHGGPQIGNWLRQVGLEFWGTAFRERWQQRTHIEVADTMCQEGGVGFGTEKPNCAYNHSLHKTGYRYLGQAIGHGLDGDGLSYTLGSTLTGQNGRSWSLLARYLEINRAGSPDAAHSLSPTPQRITEISVSHSRRLGIGTLRAGLGYQELHDELAPGSGDGSAFGWVEYTIN